MKNRNVSNGPSTIDGMDVNEVDLIWLHQNEMWEYMDDFQDEEERHGVNNEDATLMSAERLERHFLGRQRRTGFGIAHGGIIK